MPEWLGAVSSGSIKAVYHLRMFTNTEQAAVRWRVHFRNNTGKTNVFAISFSFCVKFTLQVLYYEIKNDKVWFTIVLSCQIAVEVY